jgi:hypothetical protein
MSPVLLLFFLFLLKPPALLGDAVVSYAVAVSRAAASDSSHTATTLF